MKRKSTRNSTSKDG